jgi:DNA polymerase III gamma/tau subunit
MKYACYPAFNALLKNLKPPPSNVKFILINAEIKRILTSIIVHCRFDLHNIPVAEIMLRLNDITNPLRC